MTNVKFCGYYSLTHGKNITLQSSQETIRIIDTWSCGKKYNQKKLDCRCDFADYEARNVFRMKEATPSINKFLHRCNYCGLKDSLTNDNVAEV